MHILMGNLEFAILFVSAEESPLPEICKFVLSKRGRAGNLFRVMKFEILLELPSRILFIRALSGES